MMDTLDTDENHPKATVRQRTERQTGHDGNHLLPAEGRRARTGAPAWPTRIEGEAPLRVRT